MKLFCFGFGYTASYFAKSLEWEDIFGTHRADFPLNYEAQKKLAEATHILHSVPPDENGDLLLRQNYKMQPEWVGYLSTTGVYGNHDGGWVDEETRVNPNNARSAWRVLAENQWQESGLPVNIYRLSGIYGVGRSVIDDLRAGTARRIEKPNQFFSRIHVEDIAQVLQKSLHKTGEIYNCADNLPCSAAEVVEYAAKLLNIAPPPLIPFEKAELSEMARSFYSSSRRMKNNKIKQQLAVELKYPTYKEGLLGIINAKI